MKIGRRTIDNDIAIYLENDLAERCKVCDNLFIPKMEEHICSDCTNSIEGGKDGEN